MKHVSSMRFLYPALFLVASLYCQLALGQTPERARMMSEQAEAQGLAAPFKGITTDGSLVPDLFPIRATGVSTDAPRQAALDFLHTLSPSQRAKTTFPIDDPEWRKWMNQHFYLRQGVGFDEMDSPQRKAAFALIESSLSAKGLKLTRDIMRLNHSLGELNQDLEQYGEWLYWITIMGEPSPTQPWGWQLDGHHVIINYFVLGDQVVMTPLFVGSEPVVATSGKYKGTAVLQEEQAQGLAMMRALSSEQQGNARISGAKTENNNLTEAFKDNVQLDYAGIPAKGFAPAQKTQLLSLIRLFVDNMDEGHAQIRMEEVEAHLDNTHFAWIGETGEDAVFYFRIHSPVILIEFDHQRPVGMRHLFSDRSPNRQHIHVVVRTPNGNDYGKDLLRQHYEAHPH